MTPEARSNDPDDPGASAQADLTDFISVVARIKRSLGDHLPYWDDLPGYPPIEPFTELWEDLRRLRSYLRAPVAPKHGTPAQQLVSESLRDTHVRRVIDSAFTTLSAYVNFRVSLDADELALWDESLQSARALSQVWKDLALLRRTLDELTPRIM
jgi:hypothetical protein